MLQRTLPLQVAVAVAEIPGFDQGGAQTEFARIRAGLPGQAHADIVQGRHRGHHAIDAGIGYPGLGLHGGGQARYRQGERE
mgnify:CR=1 FL=1